MKFKKHQKWIWDHIIENDFSFIITARQCGGSFVLKEFYKTAKKENKNIKYVGMRLIDCPKEIDKKDFINNDIQLRGQAIDYLLIDNAFYLSDKLQESIIFAINHQIKKDGKVVLLTSGIKKNNKMYEFYEKSKFNKTNFKVLKLPYYMVSYT